MLRFVLALALLSPTVAGADAAMPNVELLTELNQNEVYEGHLVLDGRILVTQSRQTDTDPHRVDVFGTDGALLAQLPLIHTAAEIHAVGAKTALVVGKSSYPWKTHYTLIDWTNGRYDVRTQTFPEVNQVVNFGGTLQRGYFSEPGERAVMKLVGQRGLTRVGGEVSGPGAIATLSNDAWVIEQKAFPLGDENLVKIDASGVAKRIFSTNRLGLTNIVALPSANLIAVSETAADQVVFVDATGDVVAEVPVAGSPRGLTALGSCALVVAEDAKTVTFIKLWGDRPAVLDVWDLNAAGDRLKQPRRIGADAATGRVFVRSTYMCPSCSVTQSSVFYADQPGNETFSKCLAN
jgi:hypothetical protein